MKPLQLLTEAVIEILKTFSSEKRPLTVDSLREALAVREEICSLLNDPPEITEYEHAHDPSNKIARVSLKTPEPVRQPDFPNAFGQIMDTFKIILASMEPMAREDSIGRASELRQRLNSCHTMESLARQSGEIASTVNSILSRDAEEIAFANEFLAELSQNLSTMEEQLFSYQSHNRETYMLNGQFCDDLLFQTREMDQAFVFAKALEDARSIISSRLSSIGKAIQEKRQEDEIRLKKADTTIAEHPDERTQLQ